MSQASSRKLTTAVASRIYAKRRRGRRKLRRVISNHAIIAVTTFLSKKYGLLPCFCNYDPLRMMRSCQSLTLSKSSNAFWHRKSKSRNQLISKKQQRNNSTSTETQQTSSTRLNNFKTFRKSIVQRFKRNKKKKLPTITARSVIHKRTNMNTIEQRNSKDQPSIMIQPSLDQPLSTQCDDSQHSSSDSDRIISQDNSYDNSENDDKNTLEPTASSFTIEQQNINATNNTSQTIQQTTAISRKKPSNDTRNISSRSTINSSKRKKSNKQKGISKRKTTLSKKRNISTSKRKSSKAFLSRTGSRTNVKRKIIGRSPFPNPNIFHSIPPMQNSDEITKDNIHDNHLCCKPITSVKDLSTNDQKKLIEHDYLTLISLLPMYLGSQGNFQNKIREKTNISHDGALELDRLMNKWSSTRLFIGANSHYKTLTQTI